MFDWYKRLWGEGKIRVECILSDGRKCTVKMPYIGDLNTMDRNETIQTAKNYIRFEHGYTVVSAKIVDIIQY